MSAVLEIEDFKGGVNAVEAATAELPEYNKGVNAVEAAVNELPSLWRKWRPSCIECSSLWRKRSSSRSECPSLCRKWYPTVANIPAYGEVVPRRWLIFQFMQKVELQP